MRFALMIAVLLLPSIVVAQSPASDAASRYALMTVVGSKSESPDMVVPNDPQAQPAEPISYKDAYALYKSDRKPMVVMLTQTPCAPCSVMKAAFGQMEKDGDLASASLVYVDVNKERALANEIDKRRFNRLSTPYLVVYHFRNGQYVTTYPKRVSEVPGLLAMKQEPVVKQSLTTDHFVTSNNMVQPATIRNYQTVRSCPTCR